ncbi:MAG: hypothetical protein Q9166_005800 [cf. Caloplaca sp. 2 TL-2023]
MSVGFGFSVGDFIGAIKLVGTVIDALSASSKSSSELQELLRQLYSLETALREIQQLEVDESLHAEVLALKQSAAQCQLTITQFLRTTESYKSQLVCSNGATSTVQCKWKRVKWALCKRKDIVQFKADLLAHTESIQLLLTTIQMKHLDLGQRSQKSDQRSVALFLQTGFSSCMRKLRAMSTTLTGISTLAQECVENGKRILSINLRVFQIILDVQNILRTIPGQIERQQPVYLNDALGRYSPFHLEFIRSREALFSVLSINFKWLRSAAKKIQNSEFAIHDSGTERDIDLNRPWDQCFTPGQHVKMSMIFDRPEAPSCENCGMTLADLEALRRSCPGCRCLLSYSAGEDVECGKCGLIFRSLMSPIQSHVPMAPTMTKFVRPVSNAPADWPELSLPKSAPPECRFEEDLREYRRVRIRLTRPRGIRVNVLQLQGRHWRRLGTGFGEHEENGKTSCFKVLSETNPDHTLIEIPFRFVLEEPRENRITWTASNGMAMALEFYAREDWANIWKTSIWRICRSWKPNHRTQATEPPPIATAASLQ